MGIRVSDESGSGDRVNEKGRLSLMMLQHRILQWY